MKFAAKLLIALLAGAAMASAQSTQPAQQPLRYCHQFVPYGTPTDSQGYEMVGDKTHVLVCRTGYLLLSDEVAKIPTWVVYTLAPEHTIGCVARSNAFAADRSLPEEQSAKPEDYDKSGYDKGHIAPDGDMSWDEAVERESFLMTNMTPQLPGLNRGIWKLLESDVRAWAYERNHTLLIYAGPIYDVSKDKKIGPGQVDVPTAFYKTVVDTKTSETLAFVFPAAGIDGNDLSKLETTVFSVESQTGIKFPLPDGVDPNAAPSALWPVDQGAFAKAKRATCAGN